jgi:phage terminase Nu1 subunit (DNA packaging protein)
MRSTHASGAALFGLAPRTAQRVRRPLAVSAASTAGNGELRARYAVRPLLGRREEAAATLARWAREVADGDGSRSVEDTRLELSARVHGSAWGGDTVELEVTLDERQLPRLLALLRSPSHARCVRPSLRAWLQLHSMMPRRV